MLQEEAKKTAFASAENLQIGLEKAALAESLQVSYFIFCFHTSAISVQRSPSMPLQACLMSALLAVDTVTGAQKNKSVPLCRQSFRN